MKIAKMLSEDKRTKEAERMAEKEKELEDLRRRLAELEHQQNVTATDSEAEHKEDT